MLPNSLPQIRGISNVKSAIGYGAEYIDVVHQWASLLARKQSFYALIKQFRFVRCCRTGYPLSHGNSDFLPAVPKLKPD